MRHVVFQTSMIKVLKEVANELKCATAGTKRVLFDRLRDCPDVTRVGEDAFDYQHVKVAGGQQGVPMWVILGPEKVPDVEGINMATGAEDGFFAPTNKENAVGGKRANFMTKPEENLHRPDFVPKQMKKRKAGDDTPPPPVREDSHPSPACRKLRFL